MWASCRQAARLPLRQLSLGAKTTFRPASSGSNPYPFPAHENPNPYQIFHLPHSATQADVKKRYIDLVRIYHPDSPVSRALPREVTDGRFQSITKAYDALRGRTVMNPTGFQGNPESRSSKSAAWRAQRARRLDLDAGGDDRWKDKMLVFGAIFTIAAFVAQTMWTRNRALAELRELQDIRTSRHSKKDSREMADSDLDGSSRKS